MNICRRRRFCVILVILLLIFGFGIHGIITLMQPSGACGIELPLLDDSDYNAMSSMEANMRSRALWPVASYPDLVSRMRRIPARLSESVCVRYGMVYDAGLGNQWVIHTVAAAVAALVGATSMQIPPARGRDRADIKCTFFDVNRSDVMDVEAHHSMLRELGIQPVESCPPADFTYHIRSGALIHQLEDNVNAAIVGERNARPVRSVTVEPYFDPKECGYKKSFLFVFSDRMTQHNCNMWPSRLMRAIFGQLRFIPATFRVPKPYGVFHLRAEADNNLVPLKEQLKIFDHFRGLTEKRHGPMNWYVASGIYHSGKFELDRASNDMRDTYFRVQNYRKRIPFKTAEDFDPSLKTWSLERRASLDYSVGLDATVVVGVFGSSYAAVLAQLRWARTPYRSTYVYNGVAKGPLTQKFAVGHPLLIDRDVPRTFWLENNLDFSHRCGNYPPYVNVTAMLENT